MKHFFWICSIYGFFPEVRKYLASKELPFKVVLFFFLGGGKGVNSHSHPEPHEFRTEGTNVVYLPLNTMSLIQPLDQRVIRTFTTNCELYGRESWWNIIKVWKDYTLGDAITVIEKKTVKSIKLETINSFWRKLCPDVAHGSIGFTIEPIKEIMWM